MRSLRTVCGLTMGMVLLIAGAPRADDLPAGGVQEQLQLMQQRLTAMEDRLDAANRRMAQQDDGVGSPIRGPFVMETALELEGFGVGNLSAEDRLHGRHGFGFAFQ